VAVDITGGGTVPWQAFSEFIQRLFVSLYLKKTGLVAWLKR
jgi:hypothetical protein